MSSSTAIKASWVDTLPQSAQNIVLPLCKAKGLNALNIFPLDFHFTSQIKSSSSNIIHYSLLIIGHGKYYYFNLANLYALANHYHHL